jgi:hypothetical protein
MKSHLQLLGLRARDCVTGFTGVITSVSFDLFGCVQAVIAPPLDAEGKIPEGRWFDVTRLVDLSEQPVMPRPDFEQGLVAEGRKGPADKPAR